MAIQWAIRLQVQIRLRLGARLIIIFACMFFGNPELLQRNLHNDLNTLIKNVKAREDQYLTLLQYNKNMINNFINSSDQIPFFYEELNKHKSFLASSQAIHEKMKVEEDEIVEKYGCAVSGEQNIVKLLGRVTGRVLEICQASLEKGKFLDFGFFEKYNEFKAELLGNLNETGKINIQAVLETIIDYSVGKDKKEIQRLEEIVKYVLDGDIFKLSEIYASPKQQPKKPVMPPLPQKKQPQKQSHHPSPQKSKQKSPQKQRQEQSRLALQKTKKKKTKVAKELITNFYSTMDLSKQQFLQDFTYTTNPEEKKRRLYEEMFSRNKFNHEQILEFQAKKDQFQIKVREFKAMMEMESKRLQQALVIVVNKPVQEPKMVEDKLQTKVMVQRKETKSDVDENEQEESSSPERLDRVFRRRDRKEPIKAPSPRFAKQIAFSSMQSTQQGFQHIKFDVKGEQMFARSNRARLPQIPGRSSLDTRYERKNDSRIANEPKKDQKRISIVKNVEIGSLNNSVAKNSFLQSSVNNRKSPRDRSVGQPLFENVANINLNSNGLNGLDYTFYVRKKVTKFYETKNNFVL